MTISTMRGLEESQIGLVLGREKMAGNPMKNMENDWKDPKKSELTATSNMVTACYSILSSIHIYTIIHMSNG